MCNSCDALTINGVYCHETGCPNREIGTVKECKWCGTEFVVESLDNTLFCCIDCGDSYYN